MVSGHGYWRGNQDLNQNQDQTRSQDYQPRPRQLQKRQHVVNLFLLSLYNNQSTGTGMLFVEKIESQEVFCQ
jgi:hypothetical protein